MPEKTVVVAIRMTEDDYKKLNEQAQSAGVADVSVFARHRLAEVTPGMKGNINPRGGKRPGAGRKPKSQQADTERSERVG